MNLTNRKMMKSERIKSLLKINRAIALCAAAPPKVSWWHIVVIYSASVIFDLGNHQVYAVNGIDPTQATHRYDYGLCDEASSFISRTVAGCIAFSGGTWHGTHHPNGACQNTSPVTQENAFDRAEAFTKRIDGSCDTFDTQWTGWLSPGEFINSNSCWSGEPNINKGVETHNLSRILVKSFKANPDGSCDTSIPVSESIIFRRDRDCPNCIAGDENIGKSCPAPVLAVELGNPIHAGTGNKFQSELDYQSPVLSGLSYRRYYNSMGTGLKVRYGSGWSADYWQRVVPQTNTLVEVRRPDGRVIRFEKEGGQWQAKSSAIIQLEEVLDSQTQRTGWRVILENDTQEEYWDDGIVGRPISITTRQGQTTTLSYDLNMAEGGDDDSTTLDRVTGPFGRTLSFMYNAEGHITAVIDPAGQEIHYTRDINNNLNSVSYPDDTPLDLTDNPTRIYHYEEPSYTNLLTGITDENGNRFASWEYDNFGRAISSEHAGGAERVDIVYNPDGTTTATDSLGQVQTYHFRTIRGLVAATHIDGGPCQSCGDQAQQTVYDANGFVHSRTDFNGNTTVYVHNSRGLETSRTEAVGTPQARSITTDWHTDFRLPVKITEPGRVTEFTYDNQGRLLSRKVSAL